MVNVSRISLDKKGLGLLSPLENDVIRLLWKQEDARVRDIYNVLRKRRKVALTSVAVILDRLHKKGIVKRRVESGLGGYHYIYSSKADEALFAESVIDKTVNKLIDNYGSVAVTYFNERFKKKMRNN